MLVRYDEVAAGTIDHAIRFTAPRTQNPAGFEVVDASPLMVDANSAATR